MSANSDDIVPRASRYAAQHSMRLEDQLGSGLDGIVFRSDRPSAVKVFERADAFLRELGCYQRFRDHNVLDVHGHHVPQMIASDSSLLVIEMTVVQPPYLLDFAGAWLDEAPDFSDENIEQWHQEKIEQFGEARWKRVQLVVAILRGQYSIHLLDVNPGNITFGAGQE